MPELVVQSTTELVSILEEMQDEIAITADTTECSASTGCGVLGDYHEQWRQASDNLDAQMANLFALATQIYGDIVPKANKIQAEMAGRLASCPPTCMIAGAAVAVVKQAEKTKAMEEEEDGE